MQMPNADFEEVKMESNSLLYVCVLANSNTIEQEKLLAKYMR